MGFIDYLVVVGIIALILAVYRQLDRNNRSLEKVKKLGDRLMDDLDAVAREKLVQLKDIAIEVEVHQEASRKAIEHLHQAESALEAKAVQLEELQGRISGYDAALLELIGMTQKAEENIGRLREESSYIDKVGRRIRQAAGQLQELQNRLPGMLDEFRSANESSLEQTREQLLGAIETRHATLERRIEAADQGAAERIHKMQQLLETVETDLSRRVDTYRGAFEGIEQEYHQRLESVAQRGVRLESEALSRLGESIQRHMEEKHGALREDIENLGNNIRQAEVALEQELQGLKQRSSGWENEMAKSLEGINGRLFKALEERDVLAREELEKYHLVMQQAVVALQADLARIEADTQAQTRQMGEGFAATLTVTRQETQSWHEGFRQEILAWQRDLEDFHREAEASLREQARQHGQTYEQALSEMSGQLDQTRTELENQVADAREHNLAAIAGYQDEVHQRLDRMQGQLYEAEQQTEQRLLESQQKGQALAEALLTRISNDVDAKTASMREAINQRVEDVNASVKASHDQIDSSFTELKNRVDGWIDQSRHYMGDLETKLQELGESSRQASQEQRETLDAYIQETRSNLDSWERQLGSRVQELESFISRAEDLVKGEFKRLDEETRRLATQASGEMQEIFATERNGMQSWTLGQIAGMKAELQDSTESLASEYRQIFDRIETWETETRNRHQDFTREVLAQTAAFSQATSGSLEQLEQEARERHAALGNEIKAGFERQGAEAAALLSQGQQGLAEIRQVQAELGQFQAEAASAGARLQQELHDRLQAVSRTAGEEREALAQGFARDTGTLRDQFDAAFAAAAREAEQRMDSFMAGLAGAGKTFQDELEQWKRGLEARIEELTGLSRGLHKDTLGQVQKQVQDVQQQAQDFYARIQDDLRKGLTEQETRIQTLLASNEDDLKRLAAMGLETQDRIRNWQELLQTTSGKLDADLQQVRQRAIEEAGSQIKGLRDVMTREQDEILQNLNEGFARLKSEVHHSRTDVEQDVKFLNQQIEQWKATFQDQLRNLEAQSRAIEDDALEGLKGRINDLREEAKGLTRKVQDEFAAATQETQGQIARQIEGYQVELRKLQSVRSEVDGRIGELNSDLQKTRVQQKAGMDALVAEHERLLKEFKDRLVADTQTRVKELQDSARLAWEQGQGQVLAMKSQQDKETERVYLAMEQSRTELQEKIKGLQLETQNLRRDAMGSIQERIDAMRDESRKLAGQVKSEINALVAEHQGQVEKQLKNSEDEFHRIQDLNSTAQLRFQEIQDIFNRAEQMAMKEYDSLREKVRQLVDQNTTELQKELGRQQADFQNLVQQNLGAFSDSVNSVRTGMQQDLQLLQGEFSHYQGDMEERFKTLGAEARKLQDELAAVLRTDLEKVRKQGEVLAQGMHEQVLKGLEGQRQSVAALVQQGADDLAKSRTYSAEAQAQMESARDEVQQKVVALEASIKTYSRESAQRIEQVSEEYQQKILGEVEKRLKDYEQEISYRMGKIETVNDDIDNLETNLRKSMDRLAQKLKEDVDRMGAEFRSRHQSDVEASRKDMESVNLQVLGLEKELNDLKSRAYDNVSKQLQIFEDEFFGDLKNRSQKMDQRITDWKNQVEAMLAGISEKELAERKMLEDSYSNLIKTRLGEMEANFKDRLSRTGEEFETFQASLQERLLSSEQGIQRMQSELKEEVQGMQANTLENVQREFVRMNQDLENRIRSYEREVESRLQKGDQEVRLRQSDMTSVMDAVRNDVSLWQTQVLNQIRVSGESLQEELVTFRRETEVSVNQIQNLYAKERDELAAGLSVERNQLRKEVGELGDRLQRFGLDFDQKSRETIDQFNRNYQLFLADMQNGNAGLKEEVGEQVGYFKDLVASTRNEFDTMQRKLMTRLDDDLRNVDTTLKDMDKRIKAFAAQTKLFERADILRDNLSDQIEKMRLDLQQIEEQRKTVLDLDSYLSKVRKLAEEANEKIGKLTAEKRRLDSLDEDYKKLINISNVVDQKIAQVTASNDTLTEIQLTLRHLEDVQKDVNAKYERLERKSDIIDATSEGVERSFQQLQGIESQIQGVQAAMRDLPGQVNELTDRVRTLMSGKKDADSALRSVSNLDKILKDVEARIQELNTSREWIARTETRLNELTRDADEKVGLLSALVKKEVAGDKALANPGGPSQSVREIVLKLAQQGWRVEEIARTTKLSRGEVELILEMRAR